MNNFRLLTALLAGIALLWATIATGEQRQTLPLHLSDATAMAMKLRPELRLENEKQHQARSRVKETRGNFLPALDLTGSSSYIKNYDSFTGIDISARIAGQDVVVNVEKEVPPYLLNSELDLSYNLWAGGRDSALLGKALSRLESEKYSISIAGRKIRLEVARAYWNLKKAKLHFLMAKGAFAAAQMEMRAAEKKHQLARLSDMAYDAALLKNREKRIGLKTADRDCLHSFTRYLRVLGIADDGGISSAEQVPALADDPDDGNNGEKEASVHPELLKIKTEIQADNEQRKVALSSNYPTIDFFARYALIGRDSHTYFDSWTNLQSDEYVVGIKITLNLFNGWRTEERIDQAETEVRMKQLQLQEKERQLAEAAADKKTALEEAKDQLVLAMAREKLKEAERITALSEFQAGKISELDYRQKGLAAQDAVDEVTLARIDVVLADDALNLLVSEDTK